MVILGVLVVICGAAVEVVRHSRPGPSTSANADPAPSPVPTSTTAAPPPGRYQQPPDCARLNSRSLTFRTLEPQYVPGDNLNVLCQATAYLGGWQQNISVSIVMFLGSDWAGAASSDMHGDPVRGTDFENAPEIETFEGDACFIKYIRGNEYVSINFSRLDASNCERDGMPYATRLYPLIG